MKSISHLGHLVRRFFGSLSRRPPVADDTAWAFTQLLPWEAALWQAMPAQDRRHSIVVARRFMNSVDTPTRAEVAGALLHDVGKGRSGLGTFARVVATVVGPRTKRFRLYHDHEAVGVEMLREAGADQDTLALLGGTGRAAAALREADAI